MSRTNKKGVSAVVGYVLLIVISISVAGTVYFWLNDFFDQEEILECSEDVSLLISEVECEDGLVNISFKNFGFFDVAGYVIRGGRDPSDLSFDLEGFVNGNVNSEDGVVFFGENFENSLAHKEELSHIYSIGSFVNIFEIIPVRFEESGNGGLSLAVCSGAVRREVFVCSGVDLGEVIEGGDWSEEIISLSGERESIELTDQEGNILISFERDEGLDSDFSDAFILQNNDDAESSYLIVNGLELPEGETKTVYFDAISGSGDVCVRDEGFLSVDDFSEDCNDFGEVLINCPGTNSDYGCTYADDGRYAVSGLSHSGVLEMDESEYVYHWVSDDQYFQGDGYWKSKFLLSEIASLPNAPTNFDDMKLGYSWVNNVGTADTSDDLLYITVWDSEYVYHWVSEEQSGIGAWKSRSLLKDVITGEHAPTNFADLKLGYSYINTFGTADTSDDKLMISVWDSEYAYRWAADMPFNPGAGEWIEKYSHSEYLTDPNSPTNLDDLKLGYSYVDEMGTSSLADDKTKFVVWDSEYAYRWEFKNVGEGVTWETRIPLSEILETDSSSPSESNNVELGYSWMNSFGSSDVSDDRRYISVWTNGYLAKAEVEELGDPIVFILAGQSNMLGWGEVDALVDQSLLAVPDNVDFYYADPATDALVLIDSIDEEIYLISSADVPRFGPEISLIHELAEEYSDRKVVIVKFAVGATGMKDYWDPARFIYRELIGHVKTAVQGYSSVEYGGMFWFQGESDAKPSLYDGYLSSTERMIEQVRSDLGAADMPFFMGKINPGIGDCPWGEGYDVAQIREWQGQVGSEVDNVYLVDSEGLSCFADDVMHFDTASLVTLGYLFGEKYGDYLVPVEHVPDSITTYAGLEIMMDVEQEAYNSLVDRPLTIDGKDTYNYAANIIETAGPVYRAFFGGRYQNIAKGMDGDHIFQYKTTDPSNGWENIRTLEQPLFNKGNEDGYETEWFKGNTMDPEVIIKDGVWHMWVQLQIREGEKVDISEASCLAAHCDRIMHLSSTNGLTWIRDEEQGVIFNMAHQRKIGFHHHELIYVNGEYWLYVFVKDEGAVPGEDFYVLDANGNIAGKYWRIKSTDPTNFDLGNAEAVSKMSQIGNQIGYLEGAFSDGSPLYARITFVKIDGGLTTVPTMQFSEDGLIWSLVSEDVQLASPYSKEGNENSYFLGISTQNGLGRIKYLGEEAGYKVWEAYYSATAIGSAAKADDVEEGEDSIWGSAIGYGKITFRVKSL